MKKYLLFIVIIFFSCNQYHNTNFHKLYSSFSIWYEKHHPIEVGNFNPFDSYVKIKKYDELYNHEYMGDLKRFRFELSQISNYNLSDINKNKYYTVQQIINNLIFDSNSSELFVDVSDEILLNVYHHFLQIYFSSNLSNKDKIEFLSNALENIPQSIDKFKKGLMHADIKFINNRTDRFNQIELLLNNFLFILDLEDSELDYINKKNIFFISYLSDFESWIIKKNIINDSIDYEISKNIYEDLIYNVTDYENIIKFLEFKVLYIQNELFDLALPIYKIDNDEPVWVDRTDTLDVIRRVIGSNNNEIIKDFDSCLIEFQNSFNQILDFLENKINTKRLAINFDFYIKDEFSLENKHFYLLNNKEYSKNYSLLIDPDYQYEYFAESIKNRFIIEDIILHSLISSQSFSDNKFILKENIYGMKHILSKLFIDNGFSVFDDKYEFLIKLEELDLYLKILLKHYYFIDKYSNQKILEYLKRNSFYNNSKDIFLEILNPQKYYLDDYLFLMKLNELYDEHCIIENRMNFYEFLVKIIEMKSIPYNNYNIIFN